MVVERKLVFLEGVCGDAPYFPSSVCVCVCVCMCVLYILVWYSLWWL